MKKTNLAALFLCAVLLCFPLTACKQSATIPPDEPPSQEFPEVVLPEPEPEPEPETTTYLRCTADSVNLRAGAGTGYAVLGQADEDSRYEVKGKYGSWYEVSFRHGSAYLHAGYAELFELENSENEAVEAVLQEGYKLLGVPYVYGAVRYHDGYGNRLRGFTKQKFDCSSLTQYVFWLGGNVLLGTTTRAQVLQGKRVNKSDLARGDCMYFTNDSRYHLSGVERVGHVAVWLGDGYILHTASDHARIEKMSQKRWNYLLEIRRFL